MDNIFEHIHHIFNSDGRLLQVEYGLEAVNSSYPIVTLKGAGIIAFASKKLSTPHLCLDAHSSIHKIADGIFVNITGRTADIDYVVGRFRELASSIEYSIGCPLTPDVLSRTIADKFQKWIQHSVVRPPAFAAAICGFDSGVPSVYYTDLSAVEYPCYGMAAGEDSSKMMKYLEKCKPTKEEEVIEGAVAALLQGIGKESEHGEIEVAILSQEGLRQCTAIEIENILGNVLESH